MSTPQIEFVVLVDDQDHEVGTAEKLDAHRSGTLHRAFSIFVLNRRGQVLMQRRASAKYHSPGLWSNTCCGHPRPGEATIVAASRRLREEMGLHCALRHVGQFVYRAELDGGLIEHELDHVFVGTFEGEPVANPIEVGEWKWVDRHDLDRALADSPTAFTAWLRPALNQVAR